jgi:arylsulfatase A-like enzyme
MTDRPNVFLVVVDSLRADALGESLTPNLHRLGESGATFTQAVSTCTTTTPSFSSLLTGCYPPKHGVRSLRGNRLAPSVTTMAEAFSAAGYNTYAEVTGPLIEQTGVLRGFAHPRHRQAQRNRSFLRWRGDVLEAMASFEPPWLCLLHVWEVHRPYRSAPGEPPRNHSKGYRAAVAAMDAGLGPVIDAAGADTLTVVTGDHGEDYPNSWAGMAAHAALRRSRLKLRLERWLPALDEALAGREVGHGFGLFEHLVRVPLILAGPAIPSCVVTAQARHVDLFPTLADLCDVAVPEGVDGRSLVPLLAGGAFEEEPAYMEAVGMKRRDNRLAAVRTRQWKLLVADGKQPRLHRLTGERAAEKKDLSARFPEVARDLHAFMQRVQAGDRERSALSPEEEAVIEENLRALGYL